MKDRMKAVFRIAYQKMKVRTPPFHFSFRSVSKRFVFTIGEECDTVTSGECSEAIQAMEKLSMGSRFRPAEKGLTAGLFLPLKTGVPYV